MRIFYLDGFYFEDSFVPEGAKEITLEQHQQLLEGQAQGKQIVTDENGLPILVEPAPSPFHHIKTGKWYISKEKKNRVTRHTTSGSMGENQTTPL